MGPEGGKDVRRETSTTSSADVPDRVPDIRIEDVSDAARLSELEGLQVSVWGSSLRDVVPVHVLYIIGTTGGIVLVAYDGDRPVGFALGFLARHGELLYH